MEVTWVPMSKEDAAKLEQRKGHFDSFFLIKLSTMSTLQARQ